MLPPVLEIYVVWHPGDGEGRALAERFLEHFHGSSFSGLIGGAIEVYVRSVGWQASDDAPRPIPFDDVADSVAPQRAEFIVVVPLLGNALASAVEEGPGPWRAYIQRIVDAREADPKRTGLFPYRLHAGATEGTVLAEIVKRPQLITSKSADPDELKTLLCRDLAQAIVQLLAGDGARLTVFVSHTKRASAEDESVAQLIAALRGEIADSRLKEFFDAHDLQPGEDWDRELRKHAQTGALLALRTDLYSSREWCQREVLLAKQAGMPIVIVEALTHGEQRGSFLMDHVPRVPVRSMSADGVAKGLRCALNVLVEVCLRRELWRWQQQIAVDQLGMNVAWWAPHAPEPITFASWLISARTRNALPAAGESLILLHPDPPLGADERLALEHVVELAGLRCTLDIMTPRILATRGG